MRRATVDELYIRAKGGDKAARDRLFDLLLVSFRVIVRHRMWGDRSAEDVAQDALMAVVGEYDRILIKSSFTAWAYQVLNNKIVDHFRLKRIRAEKMEFLGQQRAEAEVYGPNPMLKIRIKKCFSMINRVHKQHARILNLHFQGYSTDDICRRMKITRNACYTSLSRARAMLRECLSQKEQGS